MNEFLTHYAFLIVPIVKIAILVFVVLTLDAYLTWAERKVDCAYPVALGTAPRGATWFAAAAGGWCEVHFQRRPNARERG